MSLVVLVNIGGRLETELTCRIATDTASHPLRVVSVGEAEVAGTLLAHLPDIDAVVVGSVREPIRVVQRTHALDNELGVVLLSDGGRSGVLSRALRFAPLVSDHVRVFDATDADAVAEAALAVARDTHLRRRHRSKVAMMETQRQRRYSATNAGTSAYMFNQLLDHAPLGVVVLDPDQCVVGLNRRASDIVGSDEASLIGRPIAQLFAAAESDRFAGFVSGLAAPGREPVMDVFNRVAGATRQYLEVSGTSVNKPGRADGTMTLMMQDVTERIRTQERLRASHEELRTLLSRLHRSQEEERTRVAREIHDEMGQLLTALKMHLRWVEGKLSEADLPPAIGSVLARVVDALEVTDMTIAAVQRTAASLRPAVLDQLGLGPALCQETRTFAARYGISCRAILSDPFPNLLHDAAADMFYVCREALTNVARHAHAANVEIHLRQERSAVVLEVRDDGVGVADGVADAPGSLGLLGMRERIAQYGGTIVINRMEPRGTRVMASIPVRADEV